MRSVERALGRPAAPALRPVPGADVELLAKMAG
jgi:hypothetical protein